jgi:hypothetical protein
MAVVAATPLNTPTTRQVTEPEPVNGLGFGNLPGGGCV